MEASIGQSTAVISRGFLNPAAIVRAFGLMPGQRVADFGSGHGYFVIEMAQIVGAAGRIYAVDVQSAALEATMNKVAAAGLDNVEALAANLELPGSTALRDASLDAVLIVSVLRQVRDQEGVVAEAHRVLKEGGKLIIIDWLPNTQLTPGGQRVSPDQASDMALAAGFEFAHSIDCGTYHWGLIFVKRPRGY